jgi:hypothetical protein
MSALCHERIRAAQHTGLYSMISSAAAEKAIETLTPRARAALRLRTNSYWGLAGGPDAEQRGQMPNNDKIADHFTRLANRTRQEKLRAHYLSYAEKFRPKVHDVEKQRDLEETVRRRLKPLLDDVEK